MTTREAVDAVQARFPMARCLTDGTPEGSMFAVYKSKYGAVRLGEHQKTIGLAWKDAAERINRESAS